jgi:hypothetical protein
MMNESREQYQVVNNPQKKANIEPISRREVIQEFRTRLETRMRKASIFPVLLDRCRTAFTTYRLLSRLASMGAEFYLLPSSYEKGYHPLSPRFRKMFALVANNEHLNPYARLDNLVTHEGHLYLLTFSRMRGRELCVYVGEPKPLPPIENELGLPKISRKSLQPFVVYAKQMSEIVPFFPVASEPLPQALYLTNTFNPIDGDFEETFHGRFVNMFLPFDRTFRKLTPKEVEEEKRELEIAERVRRERGRLEKELISRVKQSTPIFSNSDGEIYELDINAVSDIVAKLFNVDLSAAERLFMVTKKWGWSRWSLYTPSSCSLSTPLRILKAVKKIGGTVFVRKTKTPTPKHLIKIGYICSRGDEYDYYLLLYPKDVDVPTAKTIITARKIILVNP